MPERQIETTVVMADLEWREISAMTLTKSAKLQRLGTTAYFAQFVHSGRKNVRLRQRPWFHWLAVESRCLRCWRWIGWPVRARKGKAQRTGAGQQSTSTNRRRRWSRRNTTSSGQMPVR